MEGVVNPRFLVTLVDTSGGTSLNLVMKLILKWCDCCAKRQELYDLVASLSPLRSSTLKTVHFLVTMKILHSGAVTNLYIYIIIYTYAVTAKISGRLKYI